MLDMFDVVVNTLPAHDPAPDTTHTGMAFSVQQRLVDCAWELLCASWAHLFKRVLEACYAARDAPAGSTASVSVAFWCRSGRHRSVGFTMITAAVLEMVPGLLSLRAQFCFFF